MKKNALRAAVAAVILAIVAAVQQYLAAPAESEPAPRAPTHVAADAGV
jgi:hypothetical protein